MDDKHQVIDLGPEDYDVRHDRRMVHYPPAKFTLRGLIQFAGWIPLVLSFSYWGTQVHPPSRVVPFVVVGVVIAAISARDFHRTHPGAWKAFFKGLGSILGAIIIVFTIKAIFHALFDDD